MNWNSEIEDFETRDSDFETRDSKEWKYYYSNSDGVWFDHHYIDKYNFVFPDLDEDKIYNDKECSEQIEYITSGYPRSFGDFDIWYHNTLLYNCEYEFVKFKKREKKNWKLNRELSITLFNYRIKILIYDFTNIKENNKITNEIFFFYRCLNSFKFKSLYEDANGPQHCSINLNDDNAIFYHFVNFNEQGPINFAWDDMDLYDINQVEYVKHKIMNYLYLKNKYGNKLKKKFINFVVKKKEYINDEILYRPNLGMKYFELLEQAKEMFC
jgi:hypothetical protein